MMDVKEEALLNAVKVAVQKGGITGISTRLVGDLANVNDAYIYHYFKNKDELILKAYMRENGAIFNILLKAFDKAHKGKYTFDEKGHKIFMATWEEILSDPARLNFCVSYYHSSSFKNALDFHNEQLRELTRRLNNYFSSEQDCVFTIYCILAVLYDAAYTTLTGRAKNTPEYAERIFNVCQAIIKSQMKK